MSQKIVFEELDEATHDYLIAVRETRGRRARACSPRRRSSLAGCGCIAGPIIILVTLLFTLTTWIDVIYDDPVRVALLQTAGLLLGGWLLLAALRSSMAKGSRKVAGNWVYVDPLAPVRGVSRTGHGHPGRRRGRGELHAQLQQRQLPEQRHRILLGGNSVAQVTLNNESAGRADGGVPELPRLGAGRGRRPRRRCLRRASAGWPSTSPRTTPSPRTPKGTSISTWSNSTSPRCPRSRPARAGRCRRSSRTSSSSSAALAIFWFMAYVVNPPLRDDAIFNAVTKQQPTIEPRFLRAYLMDERNTRHRKEAQRASVEVLQHADQSHRAEGRQSHPQARDDQGPRVAPDRGSTGRLAAGQGARRRQAAGKSGAEQRQKNFRTRSWAEAPRPALAAASWTNWPGSARRFSRRRGRSSPSNRRRSAPVDRLRRGPGGRRSKRPLRHRLQRASQGSARTGMWWKSRSPSAPMSRRDPWRHPRSACPASTRSSSSRARA